MSTNDSSQGGDAALINASIAQLKGWLSAGELSAADLAAAFERRIETLDPALNSLVSRVEPTAPAAADGALTGIPQQATP